MSNFGWNPLEPRCWCFLVLDRLSDRWLHKKRSHISLTRLTAERRRRCHVKCSVNPTTSISMSSTINTILLYLIQKLDLPALQCLVNATIPGSQLPSANFLDELSLSGVPVLKELFGIEQPELCNTKGANDGWNGVDKY